MKTPVKSSKWGWLIWLAPLPLVLWLAVVLAQSWQPGMKLGGLLDNLTACLKNPLALQWTERTATFCLVAVLLYAGAVAYYKTIGANMRAGEEHGSAEWGRPAHINAKYANRKNQFDNIILTENVRIGLDPHKHRRNLNVLVIGGIVVAQPNGRPTENRLIEDAFVELKKRAGLPNMVFHSLRHSSTTYKLKLNHGDLKATQGDTGHAQIDMITKVYAHILDEDRKVNAQKFDMAFYKGPDLRKVEVTEEKAAAIDLQAFVEQLKQSPELASTLAALIAK